MDEEPPPGPPRTVVFDLGEVLVPSTGLEQRLAGALGVAAGACAKPATDVVLLSATELGEVSEAAPGDSSSMPHKRNPAEAVTARASARRAPGLVATLLASMEQEHQRAAGAWHTEWETLTTLLRVGAGAAARFALVLDVGERRGRRLQRRELLLHDLVLVEDGGDGARRLVGKQHDAGARLGQRGEARVAAAAVGVHLGGEPAVRSADFVGRRGGGNLEQAARPR